MALKSRTPVRKLLSAIAQASAIQLSGIEDLPLDLRLEMLLGDHLANLYRTALTELVRELVPHHTSFNDVKLALDQLLREIVSERDRFRSSNVTNDKLERFATGVKRPLRSYEVGYAIDNLTLQAGCIEVGPAQVFGSIQDYPYHEALGVLPKAQVERLKGRPIVAFRVEAADLNRAAEVGWTRVGFFLDFLRLAGVRSRISKLQDELFLWEPSGWYFVRGLDGEQATVSLGWQRQFSPIVLDMAHDIREGLGVSESSLLTVARGELAPKVHSRLALAIRWIASGIRRESHDDKIVDLCTALEVLLLPGYREGHKGEMIAIRHSLLSQSINPIGLLRLYELRSQIIHGEAGNIATFGHYWHLLLMCLQTLDGVVHLARQLPHVQALEDLFRQLEQRNRLENVKWALENLPFYGKRRGKEAQQIRKVLLKTHPELASNVLGTSEADLKQ